MARPGNQDSNPIRGKGRNGSNSNGPPMDRSMVRFLKELRGQNITYDTPTRKITDLNGYEKKLKYEEKIKKEQRAKKFEKDYREDFEKIRDMQRHKVRTKIGMFGLFCIIALAVYMVYLSSFILYDIIYYNYNTVNLIYYSIILIIGVGAFIGGIKLARNVVLVEYVFDTTFEEEIYTRLEPALREVAKVQVEMDDLKDRLDKMNLNITRSREHPPLTDNPVKNIEAAVYVFLRYIVLINLSIGVLIFMLLYPSTYTPYLLTLLFPVWWVGITSEFKLWKVDEVWAWVFLPILVIPITIILLDVVITYGTLIGLIGGGLILYAFGYRTWAKYYVEGSLFRKKGKLESLSNPK